MISIVNEFYSLEKVRQNFQWPYLSKYYYDSRTIMGARGANIQKVCSDFNVQIKIPDRKSNKAQQNGTANGQGENSNDGENSDIIRVSGRKENCEDAVAALKALVPINIEVIYAISI